MTVSLDLSSRIVACGLDFTVVLNSSLSIWAGGFPRGKEGQVRLVGVQTSQQEFLHPIPRIYLLELTSFDNLSAPMIPDDLKKSYDISKTRDVLLAMGWTIVNSGELP
ncbi:hypothetical protein NPIL_48081 [Nephila pilipes]|uniref:Uncharacterized protein n=1 Tax=Nephila pilipes TaxID=299642 RepID=A0A8X6T4I5_NEPPI|nr:hypothetical protein NPIL_48081 [Nephila pilipes]